MKVPAEFHPSDADLEASKSMRSTGLFSRIYAQVRRIPAGKVATYGQIARLAGGCTARVVGFAMASITENTRPPVPWQRVINAKGMVSPHGYGGLEQRARLEDEGVVFGPNGAIDLARYQWDGS